MTTGDKFLTAFSNLGRRKVRSVLTSTGVIVGTLTIVLMVSLASGVRLEINRQFEAIGLERVWVRPAEGGDGGFNPFDDGERTKIITPAEVARWKQLPGVVEVRPEINLPWEVNATLKLGDKAQSVTVAGDRFLTRPNPFAEPPTAVVGTIELTAQGGSAILSRGVLERLKIPRERYDSLLGRAVQIELSTSRGEKKSFNLRVRGVSSLDDAIVQVPTPDRLAMKGWWYNDPRPLENDGYDVVTVRAKDVSAARELAPRFENEGFNVQSIEALLEVANRIFTVITLMLVMVGGVALLVASIGIANTMIMAIYERTREIGTLKALGASAGEIRQMFMIEAGLLGLIGGALGLLGGWALGLGLNRGILWYAARRDLPLDSALFVVTPMLALEVLLFAALIGILAGLYPAHRAARLDPLTALRHE